MSLNTKSFSQLEAWTRTQRQVGEQALDLCPDFPRIAARHEAWWRCELQGPPLVIASTSIDRGVPGGKLLDRLQRPDDWMKGRLAQLANTHWAGDAFPSLRTDFGPVSLGMLMGAPVEFGSDTTWTHPFIADDWSNAPDWQIREDNPWWLLMQKLQRMNAENACGRYILMNPSLGGSADVLLNLRGADQLCLDTADQPEQIAAALPQIFTAWRKGYATLWDIPTAAGAGAVNWVGLWSNVPYHVLECDFNYMIGPRPFGQLFLPEIAAQAAAVGRSIFHLDGPGAARHWKALVNTSEITAIQYVTGAGSQTMEKIEMLQAIQKAGRPLQVTVEAGQAVEVSRHLDPAGLCLLIEHSLDPAGLDRLVAEINRPYIQ